MPIPNIFHFINIGPREFNIMHFISIMSAYKLNKPDKIYLYCDHDQKNNFYWEILKDILTIEKIKAPKVYKGISLYSYQYQADIIRMEKLIERGGIYMDLDMLSIKSITEFLKHNIVMGVEVCKDPNSINMSDFGTLTNAIILTEPNNKFIKHWFNLISDNLLGKPWAYHAVCLPYKILKEKKDEFDVVLKPTKTLCPFCFRKDYIFNKNTKHLIKNLKDSHTIHLWETIWHSAYISKFSVEYFNTQDNIFVDLFGSYMETLFENIDKLNDIIKNCHQIKNYNKTKTNCKMYISLCKRFDKNVEMDIYYYLVDANNNLKLDSENENLLKYIRDNYSDKNIKKFNLDSKKI